MHRLLECLQDVLIARIVNSWSAICVLNSETGTSVEGEAMFEDGCMETRGSIETYVKNRRFSKAQVVGKISLHHQSVYPPGNEFFHIPPISGSSENHRLKSAG